MIVVVCQTHREKRVREREVKKFNDLTNVRGAKNLKEDKKKRES